MKLPIGNILANFGGQTWTLILSLITTPIYLKLLGVEVYGLVGFYLTLQGTFSLLDLGFGAAMNREMARSATRPEASQQSRNLARTFETIYWGIGLFAGFSVVLAAPLMTQYWLKPVGLDQKTLSQTLAIMGILLAAQWPATLYRNGLTGLQRQVLLNVITVGVQTLRHVGAIMILALISRSVHIYFGWQILIGLVDVGLTALFFWKTMPRCEQRPRFELSLLKQIWKFALGLSGTSIMTLILSQLDKVIISKLLNLEEFGYYTIASTAGKIFGVLTSPIHSAMLPQFTGFVAQGATETIRNTYHLACQLITVIIVIAVSSFLAAAPFLLTLWLGEAKIVEQVLPIMSIICIGTAFNCLMSLPYMLQIAYGWVSLGFYANVVAVILLTPLAVILTSRYGTIGGAFVWLIQNVGYFLVAIPIMHRRLLRHEMRAWYVYDVGIPALATMSIIYMIAHIWPAGSAAWEQLIRLFVLIAAGLSAATFAAPAIRNTVRSKLVR